MANKASKESRERLPSQHGLGVFAFEIGKFLGAVDVINLGCPPRRFMERRNFDSRASANSSRRAVFARATAFFSGDAECFSRETRPSSPGKVSRAHWWFSDSPDGRDGRNTLGRGGRGDRIFFRNKIFFLVEGTFLRGGYTFLVWCGKLRGECINVWEYSGRWIVKRYKEWLDEKILFV